MGTIGESKKQMDQLRNIWKNWETLMLIKIKMVKLKQNYINLYLYIDAIYILMWFKSQVDLL